MSRVINLFVRNFSTRTRPEDLRDLFEKYGDVSDVYIPRDYMSGESRGFAYVKMDDIRCAEDAIQHLNGVEINRRVLSVTFAVGDRKTPDQMRHKDDRFRYSKYRSRSRSRDRYRRRSRSPRRRSRSRDRYRDRYDDRDSYRRRDRERRDSRERYRRRPRSLTPSRSPSLRRSNRESPKKVSSRTPSRGRSRSHTPDQNRSVSR